MDTYVLYTDLYKEPQPPQGTLKYVSSDNGYHHLCICMYTVTQNRCVRKPRDCHLNRAFLSNEAPESKHISASSGSGQTHLYLPPFVAVFLSFPAPVGAAASPNPPKTSPQRWYSPNQMGGVLHWLAPQQSPGAWWSGAFPMFGSFIHPREWLKQQLVERERCKATGRTFILHSTTEPG